MQAKQQTRTASMRDTAALNCLVVQHLSDYSLERLADLGARIVLGHPYHLFVCVDAPISFDGQFMAD